MARFYASIQGNRGVATRMGTASSGIEGHVRGWNVGAGIHMVEVGTEDVCRIEATGGSNGHCRAVPIASVTNTHGKQHIVLADNPEMRAAARALLAKDADR